jgi:DNA-binding response OmpR family regulator
MLLAEHPDEGFIIPSLRADGHSVDVTCNGDEAIALGLSHIYDVILLAVALPRRDGVTVAVALRRGGLSTPILLLTAGDGDADALVRAAGADGYLSYPTLRRAVAR